MFYNSLIMQCSFFFTALLVILDQGSLGAAWVVVPEYPEEGSATEDLDSKTDDLELEISSPSEKMCHLTERIVDFNRDLGLNFISKPKSVDIGECTGTCSAKHFSKSYYHFLSRISGQDLGERCCVPTKFAGVQVLATVYNPRTRAYETHIDLIEDAKVAECGCR